MNCYGDEMNVVLPATGCNIIASSSSFYNYSDNDRQRDTYVIYDGKAFLQASNYNQYGYSVSGQCLNTGDLVYKPEYKEFLLPLTSLFMFFLILWLVYRIIVRRLMP